MKRTPYYFLFSICCFLASISFSQGQLRPNRTILGSWILERMAFLKPQEDSLYIRKASEGHIITFKHENRFVTSIRTGGKLITVGSGTYSLEGKQLLENEMAYEIIELTDRLLIFKSDDIGVELHFKRFHSPK